MKATFKCLIVDGEKSVTHFHLSRCCMDCDSIPQLLFVHVNIGFKALQKLYCGLCKKSLELHLTSNLCFMRKCITKHHVCLQMQSESIMNILNCNMDSLLMHCGYSPQKMFSIALVY